ncbi:MAG: Metallo-dependent phosphatase-like protein, partial [Podila humilis]
RTIVVGDIHGSIDGFNGFLVQTGYDHRRDSLILAGDLVAKGPRSLKVIDRAIEIGARCVRGNHDDKVIRWRGYLDSLTPSERKKPRTPYDLDRKSEHYDIARRLSTRQYDYLRSCPLILTVPRELSVHNIPIHVVHAGIDPRKNILHQKPWVLVNVRNLLEDGTPSRTRKTGQSWAKAFNELHSNTGRSRTSRDFLVVYGHDAGRSLNVKTWTIGLDSGCVYGRALSGYVIETGRIHTVPCPAH